MTPLDQARVIGALSGVSFAIGYLRSAAAEDRPLNIAQLDTLADRLELAIEKVEHLTLTEDPR